MPKKLKQYISFTKFRLSFLVVVSALSGYLFNGGSDYYEIFLLMIGGMLVTAASNGSNQIWEKDIDGLMKRTAKRPLPMKEMSLTEAYIVVAVSLIVGLIMLAMINWPAFYLGIAAYISYVFIYTPLKRITPWAVFVGAFPGAIPPMLGAIAATGEFGFIPGILFFVQFTWQFPHFWAIAWKIDDDYLKAGFRLLPSPNGRDSLSAFLILVYTLFMIASSFLPIMFGMAGMGAAIFIAIAGIVMLIPAINLYRTNEMKSATKLMFASFVYIPVVLIAMYFDKI